MKKALFLSIFLFLFILLNAQEVQKVSGVDKYDISKIGGVDASTITKVGGIDFSLGPQPCPGTPTITYGNQVYNTILIGTQCWMAENLNVGSRINVAVNQTNNSTLEKYCYDDLESNCAIYGGLYKWNELMQYVTTEGVQGICPAGWHIPTDAEWCTLENEVDAGTVSCSTAGSRGTDAGGNLKDTTTTHWTTPNTGATNSSGFTALPAGDCSGGCYDLHTSAIFWTSTQHVTITSNAWRRELFYNTAQIVRGYNSKNVGFSVRCLKN